MSYSIDANILLYASDTDSPFQARACAFLEKCATEPELLGLTWPVVTAFLRIATHGRIFGSPLAPADARANIEALVALPQVRLLDCNYESWQSYCRVTDEQPARGDAVTDAYIASVLRHYGIRRFYSKDRDFRRYPFLEVRDPLE
ncbi:MAG: TA system VapC family ribonuclease toxin [Gammaproteobacteria bacterium]